MGKRKPTPEQPCRSVAPISLTGSVAGLYQAVVDLPCPTSKRAELLAFAQAAQSLADLAREWADREKTTTVSEVSTREVRLDVTIRMIPETSETKGD